MIKWAGFGKLLKQGFFTLLISCFILLGNSFVNAFDLSEDLYVRENGIYGFSPYDNSYDFQVINKGSLLTQKVGLTLRGIYLRDGTYMVWKYSDYLGGIAPFLSYKGTGNQLEAKVVYQGFPTHYAICDYFTGNSIADYDLTGCSVSEFNSDSLPFIASFMSGVSNTDNFGFNYKYKYLSETYINAGVLFCFSSEFYNRSMCFGITKYANYPDYIYPGFGASSSDPYKFFSGYGVALPASFDSLYLRDLSMSPGQSFTEGGGGAVEDSGGSSGLTGNYIYSTCTYGELIDLFNSVGWSKNFCYGGLDNFNDYDSSVNYNPIPGSGLTLNQIWSNVHGTWSTPLEWFNFWNGLYKDSQFVAMWESYPAVYHTWFDLYYQYGGGRQNFNDVVEYCNIVLSLDSLSGSVYKGKQFDSVCKSIIDNKNNNLVGGSGEFVDGLNWGGGVKTQRNAVQFIQDFFNKAQEVIPTNYSSLGLGALPIYIITFFCALIFFRFLMHK